jgi:2-polyprenyl-3-methyl-5-hydroxy-6-metoxy-1,4-benzoquinol methylase
MSTQRITGYTLDVPDGFVAGNYFDKYSSHNPIHRLLVGHFIRCARELIVQVAYRSVLDAGCADGHLAQQLFTADSPTDADSHVGIDLSEEEVAKARARNPGWRYLPASIYGLPFHDCTFDLVIACEILEHLDRPAAALRELKRVCNAYLLLSVPWEPWWRVCNFLRGKYVTGWGNSPGHVQHFSRPAVRQLVAERFEILAERHPFPWTMLLARKRGTVTVPNG